MNIVRRAALLTAAGAGAFLLFVRRPSLESEIEQQFRAVFGSETANDAEVTRFLQDYGNALRYAGLRSNPELIARVFIQSSNFLQYQALDEPLSYDGLYDPYRSPCGNRLSALWDPETY